MGAGLASAEPHVVTAEWPEAQLTEDVTRQPAPVPDGSARSAASAPVGETSITLKRGFNLRSAFSLAFCDISPIVALYTVFSIVIVIAGLAFWWAFLIVLAGQLLVAAVFGDVSSRWPFAGSVYQWARHLVGPRYGWFTAWSYIWGLSIALAALAYGASGFLLGALGVTDISTLGRAFVAVALAVLASILNASGRIFLKVFLGLSIAAEVLGSVVLGTVLLVGYQSNPLSALVHSAGTVHGGAWLTGPFIAAIAVVGWSFLGFESAGSIAEEVLEPARNVPKAIFFALLSVGIVVLYAGFAFALAVPDVGAVISGQVADPISETLTAHLGSGTARGFEVLFLIGFLASFTAVQSAVSRCIWANARDRVLPAHGFLIKLTKKERLPYNAIAVTAVIAVALQFITATNIYAILINFTNVGFYVAFALPVFGAAYARLRGRWEPGAWSLGRAGPIITYVASLWLIAEIVNLIWPRAELYGTGVLQWSVLIMIGVLGVVGIALSQWAFRDGGSHTRQGALVLDDDPETEKVPA